MSQYVIVNFIPKHDISREWSEYLKNNSSAKSVHIKHDGRVIVPRFVFDNKNEFVNTIIEKLKFAPIQIDNLDNNGNSEVLGYLIIDFFEDTGDHHESTLYKIISFNKPEKIDTTKIYNDRTGRDLEKYYEDNFDLCTSIDVL